MHESLTPGVCDDHLHEKKDHHADAGKKHQGDINSVSAMLGTVSGIVKHRSAAFGAPLLAVLNLKGMATGTGYLFDR
jgi:hypothetical protein